MVMVTRTQNDIPYKFTIKVVAFDSLSVINLMYFFLFLKNYSLALVIVKMETSCWF